MPSPFEMGYKVTSPYGSRIDPFSGVPSFHGGIDLVGVDKSVRSITGGTVLVSRIVTDTSNRTWEWGNFVAVLADSGEVIYYCHLASRAVSEGDRVEVGDILGTEGATGYVTGAHLHLEVRINNVAVDPTPYLSVVETENEAENKAKEEAEEEIAVLPSDTTAGTEGYSQFFEAIFTKLRNYVSAQRVRLRFRGFLETISAKLKVLSGVVAALALSGKLNKQKKKGEKK